MAWSKEHKEETRRRIVAAAAAALRQHGLSGIGLVDIMRQAGLTHGGFYAHFSSKEDLIAAALGEVNEARMARFDGMAGKGPAGAGLRAAVDVYLTSRHREHPEDGCFIAALGSELVRQQGAVRSRLARSIRGWLTRFARHAPAQDPERRRQQATGAFAAMIGGMLLARGAEDPHEADLILSDVRAFLHQSLGDRPEAAQRPS